MNDVSNIEFIISDSGMCLQSYPCQHHVQARSRDGTQRRHLLSGVQLWRFLRAGRFPSATVELQRHLNEYEREIEQLQRMGHDVSPLEEINEGRATQ